jgi:hypothetical protein
MMIADFRLPIELLVHPGQVFNRESAMENRQLESGHVDLAKPNNRTAGAVP